MFSRRMVMLDWLDKYASVVGIVSFLFALLTFLFYRRKEAKLKETLQEGIVDRAKEIELIVSKKIKKNISYGEIPEHIKSAINNIETQVNVIISHKKFLD